ncbi:flagellar biosynthesis protein FlhA [Pikeienuella sp. HZG-20]|uniref:flagellar biosynthesis protein FlhA n=1 Tax=Paludibacillus litoralis TaxID=3133267 RepID=UPI0030EBD5C7
MDISKLYQPTILLALALLAVIVMMILPMPAIVLDLGLTVSFGLSILVFTNTLFISRPLDFSAFPTVLLASLMLRLSLNVSSTKLIIGEGHNGSGAAGEVIQGFAMFVMGGSIYLGLVVFGVLLIVNFIVITKGAGRMAEVGARFALDGMPGRQLAIDSDMAAGAISHEEARLRRKTEQEETTFFGSLDGASKFVKGDAVAGLLITLLNLVVGLAMGVLVHGMPVKEAFETYAILTVGDGLVNQIPAVIISIAAALLLSKGGVLGSTDKAFISQLGGFPGALATVAGLMTLLALVPGLPMPPFLLGAILLAAAAWTGARRSARLAQASPSEAVAAKRPEKKVGDLLDLDEIHVEFAADMVGAVLDEATGLGNRITNMRNHIVGLYGVVIPEIRLTDDIGLPSGAYVIRIQGVEMARATLRPGRVLILLGDEEALAPGGEDAAEPVYGAPARWISEDDQEQAALAGFSVITPTEVVATHLLEVIKANFGRLFTRRALRKLLDEFSAVSDPARATANRRLLDEFIPDKVPVDLLQGVLRRLLEEQVSVRNLPLILEAVQEAKAITSGQDAIVEHVRRRLGFQLVAGLTEPDGALPMIQLCPEWEELFLRHQVETEDGIADIALPPSEFNRLAGSVADKVAEAGRQGRYPVIATSSTRRRFLRTVLEAKGVRNAVLSFEEIGVSARPTLIGVA